MKSASFRTRHWLFRQWEKCSQCQSISSQVCTRNKIEQYIYVFYYVSNFFRREKNLDKVEESLTLRSSEKAVEGRRDGGSGGPVLRRNSAKALVSVCLCTERGAPTEIAGDFGCRFRFVRGIYP